MQFFNICPNNFLRFFSLNTLLSYKSPEKKLSFKMTTAETTGPAIGPLPDSSIPATKPNPIYFNRDSIGIKQPIWIFIYDEAHLKPQFFALRLPPLFSLFRLAPQQLQ